MNQAQEIYPAVFSQARLWKRIKAFSGTAIFYLLVGLLVFAILAPFIWMVISSISPPVELATQPPHWFPTHPSLDRYAALILGPKAGQNIPIAAAKFVSAMTNSLIISSATTMVCIVVGTSAAYALVRLPVPGKGSFLFGMLAAQMLPVIVIIIPLYLVMQQLVLMDSYRGMVILYSGFMLPTVIWIMHGYFQTLPEELEEAAMIDGCSRPWPGSDHRLRLPVHLERVFHGAHFYRLARQNHHRNRDRIQHPGRHRLWADDHRRRDRQHPAAHTGLFAAEIHRHRPDLWSSQRMKLLVL
jgi:ABC-type maltose transport system permease subunit